MPFVTKGYIESLEIQISWLRSRVEDLEDQLVSVTDLSVKAIQAEHDKAREERADIIDRVIRKPGIPNPTQTMVAPKINFPGYNSRSLAPQRPVVGKPADTPQAESEDAIAKHIEQKVN